jgi:osmoprotectant transport system ATP-binding protein
VPVDTGKTAAPLEFRNVTKRYEGTDAAAIKDLSFVVPAGEVCVLVGPSGCGKTTAMRLVNRMIDMTGGEILIDGKSISGRSPADLRREIGYVIQHVGLFPHLNVANNIGTVPRLLGWDRKRIATRSAELLELVGLPAEMGKRYPSQLSGGQRQRVGVARALAADPPLMLMDEPFGAIDPINRDRLQNEFLRLQREIKKTVVFVTHDIDEGIKMGDRIAILREGGELVQYDTPDAILANPADEFVARFVGADRGLKRLALTNLEQVDLDEVTCVREGETISPGTWVDNDIVVVVDGERKPIGEMTRDVSSDSAVTLDSARPVGASIPITASLRDALSLMMTESIRPLLVLDGEGRVAGWVSIDQINKAVRQVPDESAAIDAAGIDLDK